jgi:GR25 family glycosyltransferase involved in LPS biosynthesis
MSNPPTVLWAILVKDGSKVLDYFFECLLAQDFPLEQVFLYIRTNDNSDDTEEKIADFISSNGHKFKGIHLVCESVNPALKEYATHEWNVLRLEIIGRIRQESILFATEQEFDFYFTCDVDNFILPTTLGSLIDLNKQVVAPLLKMVVPKNPSKYENSLYSTFQDKIRPHDGAFLMTNRTRQIASLSVRGVFEVDLVHCTYLVRRDVFQSIDYLFQKNNYEYRNFALSLQRSGIPQFVDARKVYGCLTLSESVDLARKLMTELAIENEELCSGGANIQKETELNIHVITTPTSLIRQKEFHSRHPFLDFEWFEAVTPENFNKEELVRLNVIESSMNWKMTSVANALSHRALWEKSVNQNQNLIILEDDAILVRDFRKSVTPLLKKIGNDFDILLLGFNFDAYVFLEIFPGDSGLVKLEFNQLALQNEIDLVGFNIVRSNAYRLRSAFGNCGYVISPKGAALMIKSIYPLGERLVNPEGVNFRFHAQSKDALMCNVYGKSASYVAFPPLVYVTNNHSESTVQNGSKFSKQ